MVTQISDTNISRIISEHLESITSQKLRNQIIYHLQRKLFGWQIGASRDPDENEGRFTLDQIGNVGRNQRWFVFIDQMVYKLYDLTEEEIAIVEERKNIV